MCANDISGTRVYIWLHQQYRGRVEGLCGNFDGMQENDFSIQSEGAFFTNAVDFGDYYKTQPSCPNAGLPDSHDTCEVTVLLVIMSPHMQSFFFPTAYIKY